jgi:hypothetical protein
LPTNVVYVFTTFLMFYLSCLIKFDHDVKYKYTQPW